MVRKKPYKVEPYQIKKLREIKKQELDALNLYISSWSRNKFDDAEAAIAIADRAHADLIAWANMLRGWRENGVPVSEYAK